MKTPVLEEMEQGAAKVKERESLNNELGSGFV